MKDKRLSCRLLLGCFFYACLISLPIAEYAFPQTASYEGKTVRVVAGMAPGGLTDMRIRAIVPVLQKYIPGNPHLFIEYMPGAGGRKAANYVYTTVRPDGLTIGFWTASMVSWAVMGETGVLYDLDKTIYLGAHQSGRPEVFFTRKELGVNSLEKLRAASGLRIGAQSVGHIGYIIARMFAYLVDLKEPRWVTGYGGRELDTAILRGEVDARASAPHHLLVREPDWVEKELMDFHAVFEVPKGQGHPHPRFARLPDFSNFAKSERERKLVESFRASQTVSHPMVLPPGTPKEHVQILREAVQKTFEDPQFYKEYEKLTGEEPRPLTSEAVERQIRDLPREPEVLELLRRVGGPDPLPARR